MSSFVDPAQMHFAAEQYSEAAVWFEQAIEHDPTQVSHYWFLGLSLLLQGKEADAHLVWMTPILEAEPEQAEAWLIDLRNVLDAEARRHEAKSNPTAAWLIRQHLRELLPEDLDNLMQLLQLSLQTQSADLNGLLEAIAPLLAATSNVQPYLSQLLAAAKTLSQRSQHSAAAQIGTLCAQFAPHDLNVLLLTVHYLQATERAENIQRSLELAERWLSQATTVVDRVLATQYLLKGKMVLCDSWQQAQDSYHHYKQLLQTVPDHADTALQQLLATGPFLLYFEDNPQTNRPIRNGVAAVCQSEIRSRLSNQVGLYRSRSAASGTAAQSLKIGYLSDCLRLHSVGWLVRWLLEHHDRDRVEVHLYSTRQSKDFIQYSFRESYGDRFHDLSGLPATMAEQINHDAIDVLVDLDSLTSFPNCVVMALKPAPIQVSWLGFDASGLPAVDYYIADPYVLPDDAQTYYQEKIWRLPQTYIAVDGFEVGTPSLRRDRLGIPSNAVVYLSSQTGLKRNPDNVRLQLQILKAVPNSYFLIKSFNAQPDLLKAFFCEIAEQEGVAIDRLRFLPDVPLNATYRANLQLADVVLDTYPYNGATTTLEALWVGLPIVTRVGEQFAARNSYTMLMNVGVSEGIAWSDAEYIEWGIRLGEDAALREDVQWKLRRSRHTAPLWNARQFAREMENAYEQMERNA